MNCPNCGRRNPRDAAYCVRCGFRLPTPAARGSGVAYRRTVPAEPTGAGGQGVIAFGIALFAGMLFLAGALAVFLSSNRPAATGTPISGAIATGSPSLPIFVQPTATPTGLLTPSPVQTFTFITPSPIASPTADLSQLPTSSPTASASATATAPPTPTAPTPEPTPVNCNNATGDPERYVILSSNNTSRTVPLDRVWCLDGLSIEPGPNYGHVKLMINDRVLFEADCEPGFCAPTYEHAWTPDEILVKPGRTLTDVFVCDGDLITPDNQPCTETTPEGAVITIAVEVFRAP